jgi:hypothetical protein
MGNSCIEMKAARDPRILVNVCWAVNDEKKCVTMPKEEAYATRRWVEDNGGVIFWFDPVN